MQLIADDVNPPFLYILLPCFGFHLTSFNSDSNPANGRGIAQLELEKFEG
jgi:hypothetical protein